ncbi:MAG: polysaccharide deacetylase, partial [Pseudonocardiaceae bacterium]
SMDYNFYVNQSGTSAAVEEQAYQSLLAYVETSYNGNRAPVSIGAHFSRWNGGAYVRAITRVLNTVCRRPETRCATYADLARWLDTHAHP